MSSYMGDNADLQKMADAKEAAAVQSDTYFTVPVTFVDVSGNTADAPGNEVPDPQFKCELFFNDTVYEYGCDGCGLDIDTGLEDLESGVAYCLMCVGDLVNKGYARIEKRDDVSAAKSGCRCVGFCSCGKS